MAKVLIIGSGGREHALAYHFNRFNHDVFAAPGNVGMQHVATCVDLAIHDFPGLIAFAKKAKIDLTLVGPEAPLVEGIVDAFQNAGLTVFGPSQHAAQLEGSKAYSKDLMQRYDIPTATSATFTSFEQACAYMEHVSYPIVIKASGLASGKGVVIAQHLQEALQALDAMMNQSAFGLSGNTVVVEEFLEGIEYSLLVLCHRDHAIPLQIAQDHKRAYDNDEGLNTGGMGAYTPVADISEHEVEKIMETIVHPTLAAMIQEGSPFTGVLFCGLMKTKKGFQVIEYNVRFGDPETEVVMLALESDMYEILTALLQGKAAPLTWSKEYFVGVVLASKGYPESSTLNVPIYGIEQTDAEVFHMGTSLLNGEVVTNGGRVLCVVGRGADFASARKQAYHAIDAIECEALFWRKDIGLHYHKLK